MRSVVSHFLALREIGSLMDVRMPFFLFLVEFLRTPLTRELRLVSKSFVAGFFRLFYETAFVGRAFIVLKGALIGIARRYLDLGLVTSELLDLVGRIESLVHPTCLLIVEVLPERPML
jgi:hypothetical protein